MELNQSIREEIYKYKTLHSFLRFVKYNSGYLRYKQLYNRIELDKKFAQLKKSRTKNRCFIVGNGPSLRVEDLDLLINEDCLATNSIYKIFDKTKWRPKYYFVQDPYIPIKMVTAIKNLEIENVVIGEALWHNRDFDSIKDRAIVSFGRYYMDTKEYHFSSNIERYYVISPTVSYFAMQAAAYLEYDSIYLIGFDNSYKYEIDKKGNVIDTGQKGAHFYKDTDVGDRGIVANTEGMVKCYMAFKDYAEHNGIKVYNATRGGKLEVFERVLLEDILLEL